MMKSDDLDQKSLMVIIIMGIILFTGLILFLKSFDYEDPCIELEGDCEYFLCLADQDFRINYGILMQQKYNNCRLDEQIKEGKEIIIYD